MRPRPLILVVIDGLTPSMLEGTIGSERNLSTVDVAPFVLAHFGVQLPGYALGRAA